MKFLHSILRVSDPHATVAFFPHLGFGQPLRTDNEAAAGALAIISGKA